MNPTKELIDLNVRIADALNPIIRGTGVYFIMVIQKDDRFTYSTNLTQDLKGAADILQQAIDQFHRGA